MRDQRLGWILMGTVSAISGGFNQWTCRYGHHYKLAPDILSLGSKGVRTYSTESMFVCPWLLILIRAAMQYDR